MPAYWKQAYLVIAWNLFVYLGYCIEEPLQRDLQLMKVIGNALASPLKSVNVVINSDFQWKSSDLGSNIRQTGDLCKYTCKNKKILLSNVRQNIWILWGFYNQQFLGLIWLRELNLLVKNCEIFWCIPTPEVTCCPAFPHDVPAS